MPQHRLIAIATLLTICTATMPAVAADPPPCTQPVLAHLDFLTGTFEVRARTRLSGNPDDWEESVGTSEFERRVLDCAVLESYKGTRRSKPFEALRLFTGRPDGKSLRVAVSDSEHGPLYVYEGEPADSGLTFLLPLTIPSGHVLLRIRYDAITRDGFATESARSTDLGKTWDTTGRAEYRRR